jgi:hypothetical protein
LKFRAPLVLLINAYTFAEIIKKRCITMKNKTANSRTPKPPPLVPPIDFDGAWKDIIELFLPEFIAFFLPKLHVEIDYNVEPTYLEQELQHILETKGYKKKTTDKLIKMGLKNGKSKWILLHIEVQSYFEKLFGRRMFIIFSWLFTKYDESLVALAIYTSNRVPKIFDHFEEEVFGTKVRLDFNAYRVMRQNDKALMESDNIFALFVLANKYVNETRAEKDLPNRLRMKEKIYELALERKISEERIAKFIIFVDRIMLLPKGLDKEFSEFLKLKFKKFMGRPKTFDFRGSSSEFVMRYVYKQMYGVEAEDFAQEHALRIKTEKELEKERIKSEKERIKNEKEIEKGLENERLRTVLNLNAQDWSATKIADVLGYDLTWVETILKKNKKKQPK